MHDESRPEAHRLLQRGRADGVVRNQRDPVLLRPLQRKSPNDIAHHKHDLRIETPRLNSIDDGLKIGPSARYENAQF